MTSIVATVDLPSLQAPADGETYREDLSEELRLAGYMADDFTVHAVAQVREGGKPFVRAEVFTFADAETLTFLIPGLLVELDS